MDENFGSYSDDFLESIKVVSVCPCCGTKYNITKATVIEERENGHLLHIECHKCKSSIVSLILTNHMGVSSVSLVTDLTPDDVVKFKDRKPVQAEDVLDLHIALSHKKIDLSKL